MTQRPRSKTSDSVRSVERAIELLAALNKRPLSTLRDLHIQTGLPKPSIVRLLRTLEGKGLVAQTASYSAYRLRGEVTSLSSGFPHEPLIVQVAEELMIGFTRREGWPLALGLFDRDAIVVRASTIPYTALTLVQSSLDVRLSLVGHALGQAFLAHLPASEQEMLLDMLSHSDAPSDASARDAQAARASLEQVRERGYAWRDQLFHERSSTIAVPVFEGGRVAASLGLTWLSAAMPLEKARKQYVPRVMAIAETISRKLDKQAGATRPPSSRVKLVYSAQQEPASRG